MGLLRGSMTLSRFMVLGPAPEDQDLANGLAQDRFRPFEDGLDEERAGWCDWRNALYIPADPDWIAVDHYRLFALRIDSRKVPAALLKSHVDARLSRLMAEKDLVRIGREATLSVQDEVKAELIRKVLPSVKTYEIAWDVKGGEVLTTASSSKAQTWIAKLFMKSFGCELQPMAPLLLASKIVPEILTDTLLQLEPVEYALEEP